VAALRPDRSSPEPYCCSHFEFADNFASELGENVVRLGKSGLKVSGIILGCMTYGKKSWREWVLEEQEGIEHIKAAYAAGINVSISLLAK
jgi:hypothetical protein